ncbi:hypothetical protein G9464_20165 [Halostella sp. JP-L12]|uniref:DUF7501 family protein n=1 Tax=Halostella TaxID=1843185 RepID=UPI000EF77AFF|nr:MULTISPECIES: hypothetical protein [Halostella]NHN49887.1 hypothetical protein [Halostella sp. JP-L12]
MSRSQHVPTDPTWSDPNTCPFCDGELSDPGAGFIDHLETSDACETSFDLWRDRVTSDIGGEWSG